LEGGVRDTYGGTIRHATGQAEWKDERHKSVRPRF